MTKEGHMMGPGFGSAIGDALFKWIVGLVIGAFLLGGALVAILIFGIPWLWGVLKPWLHSITT